MPSYMQYASVGVDTLDALRNLAPQYLEFLLKRQGGELTFFKILFDVVEHPWRSYLCSAYHDAVDARTLKCLARQLRRSDVAVAYHRDFEPRIGLHCRYHIPVGCAAV